MLELVEDRVKRGLAAVPRVVAQQRVLPTPVEYVHEARSNSESKAVLVTSPLKWMLNYAGYSPGRVKELLAARSPDPAELRRAVVHYCVLHTVFARQPGLAKIFEALRFGISTMKLPELGDLPVTTDFRDLFGEILARHMGARDLAPVFPGHAVAPQRYTGVIRG